MPLFNSTRYLREALESVLAQEKADFELIIVDDASTDGTLDLAAEYAGRDRRIRLLANRTNRGMVANWNHCLAQARGEYVRFLFGDDLFLTNESLRLMAEWLDRTPRAALAVSARAIIDERSTRIGEKRLFGQSAVVAGRDAIRLLLLESRNLIGEPPAVMFRKERAQRGFDPRYRQLVDLEMWLHLLESGAVCVLPEVLTAFRVHPGQQTALNVPAGVHLHEAVWIAERYGRHLFPLLATLGTLRAEYNLRRNCTTAAASGPIRPFAAPFPMLFAYKCTAPLLKGLSRLLRWRLSMGGG